MEYETCRADALNSGDVVAYGNGHATVRGVERTLSDVDHVRLTLDRGAGWFEKIVASDQHFARVVEG